MTALSVADTLLIMAIRALIRRGRVRWLSEIYPLKHTEPTVLTNTLLGKTARRFQ